MRFRAFCVLRECLLLAIICVHLSVLSLLQASGLLLVECTDDLRTPCGLVDSTSRSTKLLDFSNVVASLSALPYQFADPPLYEVLKDTMFLVHHLTLQSLSINHRAFNIPTSRVLHCQYLTVLAPKHLGFWPATQYSRLPARRVLHPQRPTPSCLTGSTKHHIQNESIASYIRCFVEHASVSQRRKHLRRTSHALP